MIGREFHFHSGEKGAALAVRLQPGAAQDKIAKVLQDGTVLVSLVGSAEDSDRALIKFLAGQLGISEARFDLIAGGEGEDKLLSILNIEPAELQDLVLSRIS